MIHLTHEWDFNTASMFLQSLAKSAAWRASRNLSPLGFLVSVHNGGCASVEVRIRLPGIQSAPDT